MPRQAKVLNLFIASPGDVLAERDTVERIAYEWNAINYYRAENPTILQPIRWESHIYPSLTGRAQEIINGRLVKNADILIAIFKWRLGQSTGKYDSGTVEEIEECYAAGVPILLYFSEEKPVMPQAGAFSYMSHVHKHAIEEYTKDAASHIQVTEYRRKCETRGIVGSFSKTSQFEELVKRQLAQAILALEVRSKPLFTPAPHA